MSHTPQQPADGWQPSQQQPPVYRPNEQPPAEEPPPWSPESQRLSPMSQQVPVEDVDGTVKYVGGPGMQSPPQYGPPPGVPVSPFDSPMQQPQQGMPAAPFDPQQQQPYGMPASDPFAGGGGMPVSGMPVSGMPPVSSIPASGMPVSGPVGPGQPYGQPPFGGGQFGPQGGQLVPVSGGAAGQPWGAPDSIKRKKKGGKGPMWLLLVGIVVIAAALGVGGFILFNPTDDDPKTEATIETVDPSVDEAPAENARANEASGLSVLAAEEWVDNADAPAVFLDATGLGLSDGTTLAYFGTLDPAALGVTADSGMGDIGDAFDTLLATHLGGAVEGEVTATPYRVDARAAEFRTYTVGATTVLTALIETPDGYVGFAGFAGADQVATLDALRSTLTFGS